MSHVRLYAACDNFLFQDIFGRGHAQHGAKDTAEMGGGGVAERERDFLDGNTFLEAFQRMVNLEAGYCLTGRQAHDMLEYPVYGTAARGKVLRQFCDVDRFLQMLHGVGKGQVDQCSVLGCAFVVDDQNIIDGFVQDIGNDALRNVTQQKIMPGRVPIKWLAKLGEVNADLTVPIFFKGTLSCQQQKTETAYDILYFDIGCFKVINALFHVDTGNLLLKTAANFLQTCSEGYGLCGRLEADHFVLCMPQDSLNIKKLLRELDRAVGTLHICHTILFYVGIYPVEHVFLPVDRMCDRAHMAMNTVKGQYVRRYAYYDEKMRRKLYEEQEILREMDYALAERQFCVYFQPIYSLQQHCAVSAEALVRWIHPEKGLISPGKYIPLFEQNGFVVQIDHFVWESVCEFLQEQKKKGGPVLPVSVNVSRLNFFDDHLFAYITGLLEKYHLDPELLKLEITESAYMDRPYQLLRIMRKFRSYGIKIMMDDFGSGYSSLNMLKDVEVDILKVDMKFVQDIEHSKRAAAVVSGVVQLAVKLQMDTVMEGVETQSQLDALQAMGCDLIQGYYFSRPLPKEEFICLLERQTR